MLRRFYPFVNCNNSIVKISSKRIIKIKNVESYETKYYISSLLRNTKLINASRRSNWAIENNLHWCMDVITKDERQLNYVGNTTENMNRMKKIALGMLACKKSTVKRRLQSSIATSLKVFALGF